MHVCACVCAVMMQDGMLPVCRVGSKLCDVGVMDSMLDFGVDGCGLWDVECLDNLRLSLSSFLLLYLLSRHMQN